MSDRKPILTKQAQATNAAIDNLNLIKHPLDFSFLEILDLTDLESEEPRNLLQSSKNHSIQLRKTDDGKYDTTGVRLNNNSLSDVSCLRTCLDTLIVSPDELAWIDLSFNELTTIDPALCKFPSLQILYLHGNCIAILSEVNKLSECPKLTKLSLHGNPIEKEKSYRQHVLSHLIHLKNFDMAGVTKNDLLKASMYREPGVSNYKPKKTKK